MRLSKTFCGFGSTNRFTLGAAPPIARPTPQKKPQPFACAVITMPGSLSSGRVPVITISGIGAGAGSKIHSASPLGSVKFTGSPPTYPYKFSPSPYPIGSA